MTTSSSFAPSRRQVLTAGAIAAAAAPGAAVAMARRPRAVPATFVLVHGAWHGGWSWQRVVNRLTAKGHRVFAPTLTGLCERSHLATPAVDLTTHVNDIVNEMKWKDVSQVVLCGHSYGGMVITGVAEQMAPKIASIVYLDAFVPADGQSLADIATNTDVSQPMLAPFTAERFNVNATDRAWVDSKLTPQPTKTFSEKLHVTGAYQTIAKKAYIRAKVSPSPFFDAAMEAARKDASWKTYEVDSGHDVMIDKPDELTALLERSV